jgi:flagellin
MGDIFKVATNIPALNTLFTLQNINKQIENAQERIATGKVVNRASDDPATFLASRLFESSINAYVAQQIEIDRGIDWLEKNNARLDQVADIIIEVINLTNTADSGAITSAEQQAISIEIGLLVEQIDTILLSGVSADIFNGFSLGSLSDVSVTGTPPTASSLSLNGTNIIVTGTSAQFDTSLNNLQNAFDTILNAELTVGAYVKRLEFEYDDQRTAEIQDRASQSTIRDADLAEEQVSLTSWQILQQTALVGLVQANSAPAAILNLIGT